MLKILCIFALWIVGSSYPMTSGKSIAASTIFTIDKNKKIDNMTKRKELSQVLKEFRGIHGDRYIYSEINDENYFGNKSKVPVLCKEHGLFHIIVYNHLIGQGCPECAKIKRAISNTGNARKRTKLIYGFGNNDYEGNIKYKRVHIQSYHTWVEMLKRCYCEGYKNSHRTYAKCECCEEWKSFSTFKKWFDDPLNGYREGYCLDKDILFKGNKVYSPKTCCFVPAEINSLLCKNDAKRGSTPVGVHERKNAKGSSYIAYIEKNGHHMHLGTFCSHEDAFHAYKQAKEMHVKYTAKQYYEDGKITEKVYRALMNYKVEITD